MKKQKKLKNGNAESKEKGTALGTDSNLWSKGDVSLDSKLEERGNSSGKDAQLETEQLTYSRKKKKRKGDSLIDEKQSELIVESKVNVSLESGFKEELNSLVDDTHLERERFSSKSGLNEQPLHSERKSKRKKKHRRSNSEQFEEEGPQSVAQLRAKKESSVIDGKQSDCLAESKVNVSLELGKKNSLESELKGSQLNEQPADSERERERERKRKRKRKRERKMAKAGVFEKLNQNSVVDLRDREENSLIDERQSESCVESGLNIRLDSGLKEGANFSMKDFSLERHSQVKELENISLGSGLRGNQLNEQPADEEKKKKRKRKHKMAKAGQFEKLDGKLVLELRDIEENSLIDEKQIDSHVESKMKEGANSEAETPENIILESSMKGAQLNDPTIQPERKRKRKRKRKREREMEMEKQEKRKLSVIRDNDLSERNYGDNDEAENNNKCPEHQVTNMMKTQDFYVNGDLLVAEVKDNKTFHVGKMLKTYQRKRKKSSDLSGGSLDPVPENSMIETSNDHLEKEHTTGFSENRPDASLVGEHAMPEQVQEEACGNGAGSEAALKERKRKRRKKFKESLCKDPESKDVEIETKIEELTPSPLSLAVAKDNVELKATVNENNTSQTLYSSPERVCTSCPKKKLLVLDLNGILVDVVQNPGEFKPDITVSGKQVFKRPFCDDFLEFCFRTFNVGIWSSRINKNVNMLVGFLMKKWRHNLLFCWDRKQCTITKFNTIEDKEKPLVLKELRKLWEKWIPNLPWEKGEYDESNTLLLDDSPYKALRNPANTAVFPYPYQYRNAEDSALGHGGDIRMYLEGLAAADNVQKYVEQNPFGQPAITESNPHWDFYCQIIRQ